MEKIAFAILAGGKNSRIGRNKALLEINGKTIIERLLDIGRNFPQVMIITNHSDEFLGLDAEIYSDIYPCRGPIGGIHSALQNSRYEDVFVISCDMPFISLSTIQKIIDTHREMITLPNYKERLHYVCGVYSRKIMFELANHIMKIENKVDGKNKHFALYNLHNLFQINSISFENNSNYDLEFTNINTLEQYKKVQEIIAEQI